MNPDTLVAFDPQRALTTSKRRKPVAATSLDKQTVDTAAAKVASSTNGAATAAASAVSSIKNQDAIQASADVLKLSGETLAKATPAGNNLSVGGNVLTSLNKAAQGDTFAAASSATLAVEKLSPTLAKSSVGAVANAFVLTTSPEKLKETRVTLKKAAQRATNENVPFFGRIKAAFDATGAAQQLASMVRTVGNAGWKLAGFVVDKLAKVSRVAPTALKTQSAFAKLAVSPVGKAFGFLNKWIPLLNVAGVVLSGKNAVDVFRNPASSTTSKALSIASIGTAVAGLVAGISFGFLPFLGVIGASILADVALAQSRERDLKSHDTDAAMREEIKHPVRATGHLIRWSAGEIVKVGEATLTSITGAFRSLKDRLLPGS